MNTNLKAWLLTVVFLGYICLCIFEPKALWALLAIPASALIYFVFNVIKQIILQNTSNE